MNLLENIDTIILSITDECNLRCKYCFVQKQPHYIKLDTCKQIIDLLEKNHKEQYSIDFFGGEPMLLYDEIIVPTILYTEEKNINIKFNITTNGTLLNEEKLIFLKDHNVSLLLSMDGDKETQDYNRPTKNNKSSFDILLPILPLIQQYYPDITIRGTIYPDTCQYLYDNLNFLVNTGFYNFFFCPDEFSVWSEEQIKLLKEELRKISIYFMIELKNKKNPINFIPYIDKFKLLYQLYDSPKKFTRDCNQCGLGQGSVSINYNGDIFACQELSSYPINKNIYYLGNIITGIDKSKQDYLIAQFLNTIYHSENIKELNCKDCSFFNLCELNICHANSYLKFSNFNKKPYIKCIWDITILEECKLIFLIESINKNEFFLQEYFLNILKK